MKRLLFALTIIIAGVACIRPSAEFRNPPKLPKPGKMVKTESEILESELEPYAKSGTATVKGQVFMQDRQAYIKFGLGNDVLLKPAIPFLKERYTNVYIHNRQNPQMTYKDYEILKKFVRTETAAAPVANFEFRNVPAGEYIVEGTVQMKNKIFSLQQIITVADGETIEVVLAQNPRIKQKYNFGY